MKLEVHIDEAAVARAAANVIADEAMRAAAERGRFVIALSGGHTPWLMLRELSEREDIPWDKMHIVQVDERVAPAGHADRNWTHVQETLLAHAPIAPGQVHPMPVEERDLSNAARRYSRTLDQLAGVPPVLDLVHLGLGPDGHTASLVPGEAVLDVVDADVAVTGLYQGRRRMTLTYPAINRARRILWVVTGSEKAAPLSKMCSGDSSIPAGRVNRERAIVIADRAATGNLK